MTDPRRALAVLLLAGTYCFPFSISAQSRPPAESVTRADDAAHPPAPKPEEAPPPERTSMTAHEITLAGKPLRYTATAGTLLIRNEEEKPYGSIFYVAYTVDPAGKPRPVTFLTPPIPGFPASMSRQFTIIWGAS